MNLSKEYGIKCGATGSNMEMHGNYGNNIGKTYKINLKNTCGTHVTKSMKNIEGKRMRTP
jgi:hypothetical protein